MAEPFGVLFFLRKNARLQFGCSQTPVTGRDQIYVAASLFSFFFHNPALTSIRTGVFENHGPMNDPVRARKKPNPGAGFGDFDRLRQVWSNFS